MTSAPQISMSCILFHVFDLFRGEKLILGMYGLWVCLRKHLSVEKVKIDSFIGVHVSRLMRQGAAPS